MVLKSLSFSVAHNKTHMVKIGEEETPGKWNSINFNSFSSHVITLILKHSLDVSPLVPHMSLEQLN